MEQNTEIEKNLIIIQYWILTSSKVASNENITNWTIILGYVLRIQQLAAEITAGCYAVSKHPTLTK